MDAKARLRKLKKFSDSADDFWFAKRRATLLTDVLNRSILLKLLIHRLEGKKIISLFELCSKVKAAEKLVIFRLRNLEVFNCFSVEHALTGRVVIHIYHDKTFPKEIEES